MLSCDNSEITLCEYLLSAIQEGRYRFEVILLLLAECLEVSALYQGLTTRLRKDQLVEIVLAWRGPLAQLERKLVCYSTSHWVGVAPDLQELVYCILALCVEDHVDFAMSDELPDYFPHQQLVSSSAPRILLPKCGRCRSR